MCVICLKIPEASVTAAEIKKMWDANSDGAGYAFVNDGKIHLRKGFLKLKHLSKSLKKDVEKYDIDNKLVMLHFRIGTHGSNTAGNTHPFTISDNLVFAHNGILNGHGAVRGQGQSDTALFAKLLKKLPSSWYESKAIKEVVARYASPSKLCFLKSDGTYWLPQEAQGTWQDGRWFSNTHWNNVTIVYGRHGGYDNYGYDEYLPAGKDYENYLVLCDVCEKEVDFDDIVPVGNFDICKNCFRSMPEAELALYRRQGHKKLTAKPLTVKCPLCKQSYPFDAAIEATYCNTCKVFFDEKGELYNYQ